MKIAILQFAPVLGERDANMRRAEKVLAESSLVPVDNDTHRSERQPSSSIDILVLPELAFSGYNHTPASITPLLEPTASSPSTHWARRIARQYGCVVCVGYPELASNVSSTEEKDDTVTPGTNGDNNENGDVGPWPGLDPSMHSLTAYNSLITISPSGHVLAHHRKRHLYYTDEPWAREPPSSSPLWPLHDLPLSQKNMKVVMGICMDLNPYRFRRDRWDAYELATAVRDTGADVMIVSMAWLSSPPAPGLDADKDEDESPDMHTLGYWVERLHPLYTSRTQSNETSEEKERSTIVVFANRTGTEPGSSPFTLPGSGREMETRDEGVQYAGTSWIGRITPPSSSKVPNRQSDGESEEEEEGQIEVLGLLDRAEERVLLVDTADPRDRVGTLVLKHAS